MDLGKNAQGLRALLLNSRGMNSRSIRALHVLRRSDEYCRFRYAVPTSNVASHQSDDNLIDAAADGTHI